MTVKTPIRTVFNESNVATGLAEYQTGEFVPVEHGGTGAVTHTANAILLGNTTSAIQSSSLQISGSTLSSSDSSLITINDGLSITGTLNVTSAITGNVTGNADTATALETARSIAGQSFDGTGDITIASTNLSDTSDIVLLTSIQTLTNKTLTSPTITGTGAIAGTFTGDLTGDVTGNADTATTLTTARTIAGQSFDGSANITIASTDLSNTSDVVLLTSTQTLTNKTLTSPTITGTGAIAGTFTGNITGDVTGNADTATTLETARNIGGVSFDGSANINLPGVNTSGNQDTSGNAATATTLETARTIAGQSFDGSANISIAATDLSDTNQSLSTSDNVQFADLTLSGNLTVNGNTTTVSSTNTTITDNLIELNSGAASNANDTGILIERGSTGDNAIIAWDESADKFTVGTTTATASDTGNLTITTGTLVANIEGDVTGNADTATALETARNIGGVSFDGSANINLPGVNTSGNQDTSGNAATATALETARTIAGQSFDGTGNITIASTDLSNTSAITLNTATQTLTNKTLTSPTITGTGAIAGTFTGNLTGDVTGNADTATTLETARTIAGQSFDGSANITIASTDLSNTSAITLNTATQTLTNKTINSASNTITVTEADISDLGSYITASSTDTLTNKSGNISQWTNDSGYLTSSTQLFFNESTIDKAPSSEGDFDLSFEPTQSTQETGIESQETDAFGVKLTHIYDMMDPINKIRNIDLGAFA